MSTDIVTRAAPRARSLRTQSQEDVVDGGNAATNATALEPSARMRQPYAWPALWIFPVAVLLLALLFRGIRCGRPGRRCQRLCFGDDSDSDDDDDVELGERRASESGESDDAITPVARDADVHEFIRVMRRAESRRAPGRWTRDDAFDPGTWRQLAVARELERRRRLHDNGEASAHRQPLVGLPDRLVRRASTFEELNKARVGPASRTALRSLPRCVVGSPRWFQFLRANGHIEVKIIDGSVRHVKDGAVAECAICTENFEDEDLALVLKCAHAFHDECLTHWLKIHASCPICREEVTRMSLVDRHDVFTRRRRRYVRDDAEDASRSAAP